MVWPERAFTSCNETFDDDTESLAVSLHNSDIASLQQNPYSNPLHQLLPKQSPSYTINEPETTSFVSLVQSLNTMATAHEQRSEGGQSSQVTQVQGSSVKLLYPGRQTGPYSFWPPEAGATRGAHLAAEPVVAARSDLPARPWEIATVGYCPTHAGTLKRCSTCRPQQPKKRSLASGSIQSETRSNHTTTSSQE